MILSLRAKSPQCELHRGLARETLLQQDALDSSNVQVFAVVDGQVVLAPQLAAAVANQKQNQQETVLLPDEVVLNAAAAESSSSTNVIILYGNLGSQAFATAYQTLQAADVPFVVRHLGAVRYEDDPSVATGTVLQGYGYVQQ